MEDLPELAGVVLCGGQSKRMGRAKCDLPFGSETLLQRVVRVLSGAVKQIVVVHAADQELPKLPEAVSTVADPFPFGGPLIGLRTGLQALSQSACAPNAIFLTSCDAPFLMPEFVRAMHNELGQYDAAVPYDQEHWYPLAAIYRTHLLTTIESLIQQQVRRPRILFDQCETQRVATTSLTRVDPKLQSLVNLNTPQDYKNALQIMDLPFPNWLSKL